MKIQSKIKLNHKGEQSEVGYINLLQDGYLTIDNLECGDYVLTMYVQCDSIGNISIGEQSQDITTSWNKVSYILSNVENVINIKFKKGVYYIYEAKLEKGNKATDWTQAPEDTEKSIDNVNTKAQGIIDNIYTPNTTTINGGKITTGSIKAAQIAAGTITANEIATGTITANEIAAGTITANKINLNDLFAQNITATGTINGAKLVGSIFETKASDYSKDIISISYKGSGSEYLSRFYAGSINIEYEANGVYSSSFNYDNISIISNRRALHNSINPNMSVEYYNGGGNVFSQEEYFVFKEKNFEDVKIYEKVCEVNSHYDDGTQKYSDKDTSYINFLGSIRALEFKENGTALSNKYLGINDNAVSATKATQDGNGNNIVNTYATKTELKNGALTTYEFYSGIYGDSNAYKVCNIWMGGTGNGLLEVYARGNGFFALFFVCPSSTGAASSSLVYIDNKVVVSAATITTQQASGRTKITFSKNVYEIFVKDLRRNSSITSLTMATS